MTIPARPLLRWHGDTWRLAGWLIGQFPPDGAYGESFAGAASVPARRAGNGALLRCSMAIRACATPISI